MIRFIDRRWLSFVELTRRTVGQLIWKEFDSMIEE